MSGARTQTLPKRTSDGATTRKRSPLDVATRNLQVAHAVATVAERAATHDLVEVHYLADVLVALIQLIENGQDALDQLEAP